MTEIKMTMPEVSEISKGNIVYILISEFGNQKLDDLLSDYVAEKIKQNENEEKVA